MEGLAKIMKEKNVSRRFLAEKLEVNVATVWRWEKGKRQPRQSQIAKMVELLGCTSDELLGLTPGK